MSKLTILRGLPASGKSTYAKDQTEKQPTTVRVNRDDLRGMMFSGGWSKQREGLVASLETSIVKSALAAGWDVILDNTHLNEKTFKRWLEFQCLNLDAVDVKDFRGVSISECLRRDKLREGKARVGRGVIQRMALESGLLNWNKDKKKVICDLDGTLADLEHRLKYIEVLPDAHNFVRSDDWQTCKCGDAENSDVHRTKKDYKRFLGSVKEDKPIQVVIDWVNELYKQYEVIILSGRGMESDKETEDWLFEHGVCYDYLFMRQSGDYRPDQIIKKELFNKIVEQIGGKENIVFCIDDRPRICNLWRTEGLKVYPVFQERWVGRE